MPELLLNLPLPVVLASASPRRHELLAQILATFEIAVSDVDEEALTVPDPWRTAEALALAKAKAVAATRADSIVIGGDTVVALKDGDGYRQLAKPVDQEDAVAMLMALSGKTHYVITGLAIVWPGGEMSMTDTAEVSFRGLEEDEIRSYVETGEPMDKAGSYAIQGGAAGFVSDLKGHITTVVGLPLPILEERLRRLWPEPRP